MSFDIVLREARLAGALDAVVDIGIRNGRIAAIAAGLADASPIEPIDGGLVVPGFVGSNCRSLAAPEPNLRKRAAASRPEG